MKIKKNVAISDSGFVFNPESGESFTVNPIGVELFNLLKEGKEFDEIKSHIIENYNTDEATVERDYNDFIGILKNYQLIENGDK
ncbi:MAG: PqqD family protein [Saprospiraceae bacterium]|nr:PqqD family protein [Saprospiraceae bacterium]